jgi:tRNA wybutosine-synthesizing protein 4
MIGSSALALDKTLIILGGGATCYSMGTYWQTDMYSIDMSDVANQRPSSPMLPHSLSLEFLQSHKFTSRPKADTALAGILHQAELKPIPRLRLDSQDQFLEILRARTPVIIEGLDLGPCLQKWNSNYMVDRVGGDKEVSMRAPFVLS